jgi:hypothetical protein
VPLSEHEQRLLEQIEQALYAEDPKFASIYRTKDLRSHYRRRMVRAVVALVIGLGVLLAGVVTKFIAVGVIGFVIMLAAASLAVASWQRMSAPTREAAGGRVVRRPRRPAGSAPITRSAGSPGPRRSLMQRLEERWQRRQDDR